MIILLCIIMKIESARVQKNPSRYCFVMFYGIAFERRPCLPWNSREEILLLSARAPFS